ncbi:MAG: hypothetical protein LBR09_00365 [Endomicrobium sp.]|jgi:hypothetical protein|nr:hypothetical protein [Endomicrobium sp.]
MKDLRTLRELIAIIILVVLAGWYWLVSYVKKIEEKERLEKEREEKENGKI